NSYRCDPMLVVRGFSRYGLCTGYNSPHWISRHPFDPQQVADSTGGSPTSGDAIVFFQGSGNWTLAPSTGSSFSPWGYWQYGHGVGSKRQFVADVNHDFRADSVVFFNGDGSWWVALSTGSSYGAYTPWITGH